MVAVPAAMGVATPVLAFMVATPVFKLPHVPPETLFVNGTVLPLLHTTSDPTIVAGSGFTVATAVATQPLLTT
jgi:hypothetical protein